MSLTQKSLHFARKILKYNPRIDSPTSSLHCHTHKDQKCSHEQNDTIKPYLHVHDHRKEREIYEKPTIQKLQNMKAFKQEGNQHFKNQKFQQASYLYKKIIIYADYTFPQNDTLQKQMQELLQQANCNLGIVLIKLNNYKTSKQHFCQAVRGPSPKLVKKGYYWLVKCAIRDGEFQIAKQNLQKYKCLTAEQQNQIQELERQIKKEQANYNSKRKDLFGQIFTKNR